jgi:enoyl-CoA hydratase/carnithine racemase
MTNDPNTKAAILTGADPYYCAGQDFDLILQMENGFKSVSRWKTRIRSFKGLTLQNVTDSSLT